MSAAYRCALGQTTYCEQAQRDWLQNIAIGEAKEATNTVKAILEQHLTGDLYIPDLQSSNPTQAKAMWALFIATMLTPGGEEEDGLRVVRSIGKGEKLANLLEELVARTWTKEQEHAIVSLKNGQRIMVSGGTKAINFESMSESIKRVLVHTHTNTTGPSVFDFQMLTRTGQKSSWIYELLGGGLTKFWSK